VLTVQGGANRTLQVGADEDAQHAAAIALEAKHALAAFLDPVENSGNVEPHRLRKILRSSPLHEQIAFFERDVGIPLVEEMESAELLPVSNRARDVRDGLLALARRRGVTVLTNTVVTQDSRRPQPDGVSSGRESRQSTRMR
jgi:predicted flavoprotein YhiN